MIINDNPLKIKIPGIALLLGVVITWMTTPGSTVSSIMFGLCIATACIFAYYIANTSFTRIRKIEPTEIYRP